MLLCLLSFSFDWQSKTFTESNLPDKLRSEEKAFSVCSREHSSTLFVHQHHYQDDRLCTKAVMKNFSPFIWTGAIRNFKCASKQKLYWKKIWALSKASQTHLENFPYVVPTHSISIELQWKAHFAVSLRVSAPARRVSIVLLQIKCGNKQRCSFSSSKRNENSSASLCTCLRKLKLSIPLVGRREARK